MNRKERRAQNNKPKQKLFPIFHKLQKEFSKSMKTIYKYDIGQSILNKRIIGRFLKPVLGVKDKIYEVGYVFLAESKEELSSNALFQIEMMHTAQMNIRVSLVGQKAFIVYQDVLIEKGLIPDELLS